MCAGVVPVLTVTGVTVRVGVSVAVVSSPFAVVSVVDSALPMSVEVVGTVVRVVLGKVVGVMIEVEEDEEEEEEEVEIKGAVVGVVGSSPLPD